MYAWYFPKDQPNDGDVDNGHHHDWENIIIYIDDPANETPTMIGASASAHSGYKKDTSPQRNGDGVMAEYFTNGITNHELQFKTSEGKQHPLLDWDVITDAAKNALNQPVFGDANCPFNEGNFIAKVEEAWV